MAGDAGRLSDAPVAVGARLDVDGATRSVETALRCSEVLAGVWTRWQWLFLDDGSLLELSPRGAHRYDRHRVLDRAQPLYQQLVAQDGVLVRFEARVRAGLVAAQPTYLTIERREYMVRATGTALVEAREGATLALAAWSALADEPDQNVWFLLEAIDGPDAALGLWTGGLCLSFGRPAGWRPVDACQRILP
ncbi:MAG TPA: hypothetical protein VGL23_00155 [Chloroflexota bacterium]